MLVDKQNAATGGPGRSSYFHSLLKKLKARPDSEHETMFNRVIIYTIINAYAAIVDQLKDPSTPDLLPQIGPYSLLFGMLTFIAFLHMLHRPDECAPRKIAVMALDTLCVTYAIHLGGEYFLWLYPILLWISLGNGFRFGIRYLLIAAILTVTSFAALIMFSPFWQRYPALSWGCLAGLIILPAYVSVLIRKLSEAKRQAEESNRAKSAFLASISHELRTPLTAIIGLSDLMKSTKLTREQFDMNETIGESGRSLLSLINAILDLSRLEAGRMPKKEQPIDLYRLLHRTISMIEVPARAKNVALYLHLPAEVPRIINAPLKHIEDAIINLASNAVKFTEVGHVMVIASAQPTAGGKVRLKIEFDDTGIGISKDAQARIFERFTQADETIIDKFGGTGLGLATVKQMIEDIGGYVAVESAPGIGSRFWFEIDVSLADTAPAHDWRDDPAILLSNDPKLASLLSAAAISYQPATSAAEARKLADAIRRGRQVEPVIFIDGRTVGSDFVAAANEVIGAVPPTTRTRLIAVADSNEDLLDEELPRHFASRIARPIEAGDIANALVAATGVGGEGSTARAPNRASQSFSILLADDNRVNRIVLGKILTQAGHQVTIVENGQLALEAMQNRRFDLAFFDINMPVMNGIEAAKLYTFAARGSEATPIVALTADATPEAEAECLGAGMTACLTKPIEAAKLLAAIDAILKDATTNPMINAEQADPVTANERNQDVGADHEVEPNTALDLEALHDLENLGGREFIREVVEHFISESADIIAHLETAVVEQNYRSFRDLLHALRSGAANVGARHVFKLCLQWREISPEDVTVNGDRYLSELSEALADCSRELADFCHRGALDAFLVKKAPNDAERAERRRAS